jgi:uncharacterized protein (DUF362 family)
MPAFPVAGASFADPKAINAISFVASASANLSLEERCILFPSRMFHPQATTLAVIFAEPCRGTKHTTPIISDYTQHMQLPSIAIALKTRATSDFDSSLHPQPNSAKNVFQQSADRHIRATATNHTPITHPRAPAQQTNRTHTTMKTKTRRDFIKTTLAIGATATLGAPALNTLLAADAAPSGKGKDKAKGKGKNKSKNAPANTADTANAATAKPDLVAVKGEDRAAMLDRALAELGGIGAFVKKGRKVVIKPNIGWDKAPELAANTHPAIIARLVTLCREAGASEVTVFDNTCNKPWDKVYQNSGIAPAAKAAGARILPAHNDSYFRDVKVPEGVSLTEVKIHQAILDCDVFINVPVLKHHHGTTMTACMKNLMGIIANSDRRYYHGNNLHQCIADCLRVAKPHLNILDAFSPMTRNGPQGKSTADLDTTVRQLLISTDIVAIDAAGARILGHAPSDIGHVRIAAKAGFGSMDLGKLNIARITM